MSHKWMIDVLNDLQVAARKEGKETAAHFLRRAMQNLQSGDEDMNASGDMTYEQFTQDGNDHREFGSSQVV